MWGTYSSDLLFAASETFPKFYACVMTSSLIPSGKVPGRIIREDVHSSSAWSGLHAAGKHTALL